MNLQAACVGVRAATIGAVALATGVTLLCVNRPFDVSAQSTGSSSAATINPVPLPDPKIDGFRLPEPEDTIIEWTKSSQLKKINLHGWGIWTALNMPSGEKLNGADLRVFETWLTPKNLVTARLARLADVNKVERTLPTPSVPRQFHHGKLRAAPAAHDESVNQPLVTVQYDPTTAGHVTKNRLLEAANLSKLLAAGNTDVPAFPTASVAVKPTYVTASQSNLVDGRYFRLEAWPGPPKQPQSFGPGEWKQWVWVDVQDTGLGTGTGKVDTVGTAASRTPETTYGLGRFIYRQMTTIEAEADNAVRTAILGSRTGVAVAGNYRILVAMHVTSREITRWTWQTFWWTPDPDNPPAPSSKAIALDRPDALKQAPRYYAMSIGYDMLDPATPMAGGGDNGVPVFVYNPWLEAGFGSDVFSDSKAWTFNDKTYDNKFGVQTNCMSCHELANFGDKPNAPGYTTDRYVDLKGPQFKGFLKVDFLWSIPGNAK
jgi:hypothetical protein